jgi:hypothetical protein
MQQYVPQQDSAGAALSNCWQCKNMSGKTLNQLGADVSMRFPRDVCTDRREVQTNLIDTASMSNRPGNLPPINGP